MCAFTCAPLSLRADSEPPCFCLREQREPALVQTPMLFMIQQFCRDDGRHSDASGYRKHLEKQHYCAHRYLACIASCAKFAHEGSAMNRGRALHSAIGTDHFKASLYLMQGNRSMLLVFHRCLSTTRTAKHTLPCRSSLRRIPEGGPYPQPEGLLRLHLLHLLPVVLGTSGGP